jgi:hypothetical protein
VTRACFIDICAAYSLGVEGNSLYLELQLAIDPSHTDSVSGGEIARDYEE